ncbi:Gfo/Idh/MocA family protein [Alteromonas sp. CYL-A6]|uniref:Gfo/Idh/MocA family protein n=1 Tax=Alteromonas nitratireducens TaxID=3390813 RepID=UPI0034A85DC3
MNVLVVGTGSIGQRHCRNLLALGQQVSAFSYRAQRGQSVVSLPNGVTRCESLDDSVMRQFDAIVVANSTHQHIEVAQRAAELGLPLFIEKPLGASLQGVATLTDTVNVNACVVEAGFMLRFQPNLVWIKRALEQDMIGEIAYLRAAVGQWLPDWRPDTDHRQGYGAKRACGGGVILDLVHELDAIQWLGGRAEQVVAMTRHWDALEIETEAIAQVGLTLQSGVVAQVHMDYVRPLYHRTLEIVGSRGVLVWDDSAGTVTLSRPGVAPECVHQVDTGFERNQMFLEHMQYFLARIQSPALPPASSLSDSEQALRVALAAHLSAAAKRYVCPADIATTCSLEELTT